jgi:hypothetical protein
MEEAEQGDRELSSLSNGRRWVDAAKLALRHQRPAEAGRSVANPQQLREEGRSAVEPVTSRLVSGPKDAWRNNTGPQRRRPMKKPWLAAILNFFLFGAGTLYIGKRPALPWALATIGGTIVQVLEIKESPPFDNWGYWPVFFGGLVLLKIGLAIDAFREASA